jgi:hypothetical protein
MQHNTMCGTQSYHNNKATMMALPPSPLAPPPRATATRPRARAPPRTSPQAVARAAGPAGGGGAPSDLTEVTGSTNEAAIQRRRRNNIQSRGKVEPSAFSFSSQWMNILNNEQ